MYNLQGDVIALIDASGNIVVEYKYDTWGQVIGRTGILVDSLGWLNPFRYRGYVYDEETGLYYLKSRYYNPEWGRFITFDPIMGMKNAPLKQNVFCYAANDPVACGDYDGLWVITVISGIYSSVCGAISTAVMGGSARKVAAAACGGFVSGAIKGAATEYGWGMGILMDMLFGGLANAAGEAVTQYLAYGEVNVGEVVLAGLTGVAFDSISNAVVPDVKIDYMPIVDEVYKEIAQLYSMGVEQEMIDAAYRHLANEVQAQISAMCTNVFLYDVGTQCVDSMIRGSIIKKRKSAGSITVGSMGGGRYFSVASMR
ncbi:MAG: hypothetical protein IJE08_06165 [Clostridia bacterium]|nr:hypothetical protein [Clostridia bacterium]